MSPLTTGEVAAIAVHIAIYMSEDLDISCLDIALDIRKLAYDYLAGFGLNFAINFSIDMHIILEPDGTDDLDAGG